MARGRGKAGAVCALIWILLAAVPGGSEEAEPGAQTPAWFQAVDVEWSGHLRTAARFSGAGRDSLLTANQSGVLADGSTELRLKNRIHFGRDVNLTTHYQLGSLYGETLDQARDIRKVLGPEITGDRLFPQQLEDDRTGLFDLSRTFSREENHLFWHRLDRLYLSLIKPWGSLTLGRQALTWGNGLVFHPFDLFNPFAPSAVITDYKPGEDMASLLLPVGTQSELEFLAVPRRATKTGEPDADTSSLAGKVHIFAGDFEFDVLAARHYEDRVLGLGSRGSLANAAWRCDLTWTDPPGAEDYWTLVVNCDRSWVWGEDTVYGFVEGYYNGLGSSDPAAALTDPELRKRISRGDLFMTARTYLASGLEVQPHPLWRLQGNMILNLGDGSGLLQPRVIWDMAADVELTFGATIYFGGANTEFGGFTLPPPGGATSYAEPNTASLWVTAYF